MHISKTQWETSSFGGFTRLIREYPQIDVPFKVDIEPSKKHEELTYWTGKTLVEIFLYKVKQYGLIKTLLRGAYVKETGFIWKRDKLFIHPHSIRLAVDAIIGVEEELRNLFVHYRDYLPECVITMSMPETKKDKSKKEDGKEKGEQEGEENGQGEEKEDGEGEGSGKGKGDESSDEENSEDGDGEGDGDSSEDDEGADSDKEGSGSSTKSDKKEAKTSSRPASYDEIDAMKETFDKVKKWERFSWKGDGAIGGKLKENTVFKMMEPYSRPTRYTPDEELAATQLVRTLDISFDPDHGKVKNLKVGKLDVAKIGEVPAGNMNVYYTVEENQTTKPFSVCILADESGSMRCGRVEKQHKLVKVLYRAFSQIMPPERIYVYGHSGSHTPEIRVYNDRYHTHFETTIDRQLRNDYCQNYDGPVIEAIHEKIRSFTDDNIIFISISDGEPAGNQYGGPIAVDEMKRIIEKCKRDGFVTVGIGVETPHVRDIYSYSTVVYKLEDLVTQASRVINAVVKTEFQ